MPRWMIRVGLWVVGGTLVSPLAAAVANQIRARALTRSTMTFPAGSLAAIDSVRVGATDGTADWCATEVQVAVSGSVPTDARGRWTAADPVEVTVFCVDEHRLSWFRAGECHPMVPLGADYAVTGVAADLGISASTHAELLAVASRHEQATVVVRLIERLDDRWRHLDPRCW